MSGAKKIEALHENAVSKSDTTQKEIGYLASAITRSRKLYRPDYRRVGADLVSTQPRTDFRIATVSRFIDISLDSESTTAELQFYQPSLECNGAVVDPYYKLLAPICSDSINALRDGLLDKLESICGDHKVNVVCLSELAYPAFRFPEQGHFGAEACEKADLQFRINVQKLADDNDVLILAGTYHDAITFENRALLFFPGHSSGPVEHVKLTSAKSPRIGEVIRTPANPKFPLYLTKFGTVCVLICLDAYDLNMFFRQVQLGLMNSETPPDIILVPAYSPKSLANVCMELSYVTKSMVVYTNGQLRDDSAVFIAGNKQAGEVGSDFVSVFDIPFANRDQLIVDAINKSKDGIFALMSKLQRL